MKVKVLLSIALGLVLICSGTGVWAKVSGPCADCHTMHNSQNGEVVDSGGPSRSLTTGGCIGCHTGTNASGNNIPYVHDATGTPTYKADASETGNTTLAGGSFYWMENSGDDSLGHNVAGFTNAGADNNITPANVPPGWNATIGAEVGIADSWNTNQLTCAGTNGCHGNHDDADDFTDLAGAHHGDDSTIDGATIASSYRFLTGIIGYESEDWEFAPSSTGEHNVYHGKSRTDATDSSDKATISYFCSTCHGNYHAGAEVVYGGSTIGANPWLRHPSDYDLADAGGEYRFYNGTAEGAQASAAYSLEAPVALTLDTTNGVASTYTVPANVDVSSTGNAIVTCISCHRAHGSPNADLLRWDYAGMEAGGTENTATGTGCFVCHTTKDDA